MAIAYGIITCVSAGFLLAHSVTVFGRGDGAGWLSAIGMYAACLVVGSSTIWLGAESPYTLLVAAAGIGLVVMIVKRVKFAETAAAE